MEERSSKLLERTSRHWRKAKDVANADVLDAWFDPSPLVIEKIKQHLSWILKTSHQYTARGS